MDKQWTWAIPTTPGRYWFCGTLWKLHVALEMVEVKGISNGLAFISHNSFLYPDREDCNGVWMEMDAPIEPMWKTRKG